MAFLNARIIRADKRNRHIKKLTSKMRATTCWMNPLEIATQDDDNTDALDLVSQESENICIRYHDSRIATQTDVTYTRCSADNPWTFAKSFATSLAAEASLPLSVRIVPEDYVLCGMQRLERVFVSICYGNFTNAIKSSAISFCSNASSANIASLLSIQNISRQSRSP